MLLEESGQIFQMRQPLRYRGRPANHFAHRLLQGLNFSFHPANLILLEAPGQLESRRFFVVFRRQRTGVLRSELPPAERLGMTNDECHMTKESPMINDETRQPSLIGHSGFSIDSSFVIRH